MKVPTLFKESIWLIDTIWKARRITFAEINERWFETEICRDVEMARATFNYNKSLFFLLSGRILLKKQKLCVYNNR